MFSRTIKENTDKVKPHLGQFTLSELIPVSLSMKLTRSIATPPGWNASPSQVTPQHFVAGTNLYSWVERGNVTVKCIAQEHNKVTPPRPGLKPGPLDPESNALTVRTPHLPHIKEHRQTMI